MNVYFFSSVNFSASLLKFSKIPCLGKSIDPIIEITTVYHGLSDLSDYVYFYFKNK
jgi:hypothetical protein